MSKYNEYRDDSQKLHSLLTTLATHGANTIDLTQTRRVRFVTNGGGEKVIWTEKWVSGEGWVAEV